MQKVLLGVIGVIIAVVLIGVIVLLVLGRRDDAGRNTAAIQIDRPPAQVFPWITEPDRLKQWIGGLVESTPLTDDGLEVGARSREVIAMGNERYEMETTIVDLEPPVRLVVEIDSSGFKADARYDLVESGGGDLLLLRLYLALRAPHGQAHGALGDARCPEEDRGGSGQTQGAGRVEPLGWVVARAAGTGKAPSPLGALSNPRSRMPA